jgi:uncharacterized membrane protein (DUF373 family)
MAPTGAQYVIREDNDLLRVMKIFERFIIGSLIVLMMVVVLLATVELGWKIGQDILTPPYMLLGIEELFDIFGFFLIVLIGVELLETIRSYLVDHIIHAEVVVEVAMIAIVRKVIILDVKELW